MLVQLYRRCLGCIQYHQLLAQYFDLTGGHLWINGAIRAQTYPAFNLDHEFVAYILGDRKTLYRIRIINHLGNPLAVANIEKYHATVVAAPVYPTTKDHVFAFK